MYGKDNELINKNFHLSDMCSVFMAEMAVIYEAAKLALLNYKDQSVNIIFNSKSSFLGINF